MVAPLPRRVTPVIRRAVDDLVEPAAGAPRTDAVILAARRAGGDRAVLAGGDRAVLAGGDQAVLAGGDPAVLAGNGPAAPAAGAPLALASRAVPGASAAPEAPPASDDGTTPVARQTPDEWRPR